MKNKYSAKYYAKPGKLEAMRKRSKAWHKKNKVRKSASHRADYVAKKEQYHARSRTSYERERKENPVRWLLRNAISRAKRNSLPFDELDKHNINKPTRCPVLGIELVYCGKGRSENAATLDRIIPSKGYTVGNLVIVSLRANRIKYDASLEELQKIVDFYKNIAPLV